MSELSPKKNTHLHEPSPLKTPSSSSSSTTSLGLQFNNIQKKLRPTTATTPTNVSSRTDKVKLSNSLRNSKISSNTKPIPSPTPSGLKITKKSIVSNDFKHRLKKNSTESSASPANSSSYDNDSIINSEEFKFLYKLFVPNKYLIRNNKMSLTHVFNHLPLIIPSTYDNKKDYSPLNFQIHLFLSTIMVKYVNSWYLTKLNTDNYEVLMLIYQVLMDFVKNLSNRINKTLKSEVELFNIVDELSSVINNHLLDLASEDSQYDLKIFADYYKEANTRNSFKQTPQADLETILDEYLCSNHVLFELKDDPLMYFRVLVKNLLEIIYSNDSAVNPLSSTIITNLVVVIVGDLVLALVLEKLSSPEFILKDIISNVVDIITATLDEKKVAKEESDEVTLSYYERFQLVITMCYSKVSKFVLTAKSEGLPLSNTVSENESNEINVDVFENSIFKLMDTITNFSFRKPLVSNFISFIMGSLRLNSWIYYKLSSLSSSFVMKKLISAPFLGEEGLSNIISSLRLSLFYRDNNQPSTESLDEELDTLTLDQLTDSIFNLINEKIPGAFANSYIQGKSPILSLTNENETDLKHRIRRMLIIFNYQISNTNNNNEFNETCELNKLLMIKLIDCIVRNLYPELV